MRVRAPVFFCVKLRTGPKWVGPGVRLPVCMRGQWASDNPLLVKVAAVKGNALRVVGCLHCDNGLLVSRQLVIGITDFTGI